MPQFGLGVWKMSNDDEVTTAVKAALDAGYTAIDTAAIYKNEEGAGQAIKDSGVRREDIFLTSKVWNDDQGYESTLKAYEASLERLGVNYLDLYLIHWPGVNKYKDTWRALEKLYNDGRVRAIGVSNFHIHHLEELKKDATIKPMVNQVEFHPLLVQEDLRAYCRKQDIQMEAWSPLAQGQLLDNPTLKEIGDKYGKSPAQVIIRWDLQHGVVTIPKSSTPKRIAQNKDVFDFELTEEEIKAIDSLNKNERMGSDPDDFKF
ncbi:aldo/keto reductase [Tuberibacillus sp. Marseille-P3662]|uniref:aldo/keto reductase n=1 Tax=Tuberibacillus sp. Marseille-P3662 TaxID=1965358 RepID=UPI00111BF2C9|nr:aldo/keto reductase [Tuberibacillus sp. Marseille-P3662]